MAAMATVPIRVSSRLMRLCKERIYAYYAYHWDYEVDAGTPGKFVFRYKIRPTDTVTVSTDVDEVEIQGCNDFVEDTEKLVEQLQVSLTVELRNAFEFSYPLLGVRADWKHVAKRAKEFDSEIHCTVGAAEPMDKKMLGTYILSDVEELVNKIRKEGYECLFYSPADYDKILYPLLIKRGLEIYVLMFNIKTKLLAWDDECKLEWLRDSRFLIL